MELDLLCATSRLLFTCLYIPRGPICTEGFCIFFPSCSSLLSIWKLKACPSNNTPGVLCRSFGITYTEEIFCDGLTFQTGDRACIFVNRWFQKIPSAECLGITRWSRHIAVVTISTEFGHCRF